MYMSRATNKYKLVSEVKSTSMAMRHCKLDPILKIYATFHSSLDLCDKMSVYAMYDGFTVHIFIAAWIYVIR